MRGISMQFDIQKCKEMKCVKVFGTFYGEKTFPSLNDLLAAYGKNPANGISMKNTFQKICVDQVRFQLKKWKVEKPVILHYYIYEPIKGKRRDVSNVVAMIIKCFEDALVKVGVLIDDNPMYVKDFTHDVFYTDDIPGFEVYIEEVEEE